MGYRRTALEQGARERVFCSSSNNKGLSMKSFACFFVSFLTLIFLWAAAPFPLNAGETEGDPDMEESGLVEFLWWNVVPSDRKFHRAAELPSDQKHLTGDPEEQDTFPMPWCLAFNWR